MKKAKYEKDYPKRLYLYFSGYKEAFGAPSFSKFARSIGVTTEDVEEFREHKEFNKAYRECAEIRRDYLIDNALSKRFDSSFTKFLLQDGDGAEKCDGGEKVDLVLHVLDENGA